MTRRPEAGAYFDSLAIAGKDGTLRERMRGTWPGNAHAKTGTLDIACRSRLRPQRQQTQRGYSILINGSAVNWTRATKAQDAITVYLAGSSLPGAPLQSRQPWPGTPVLASRPLTRAAASCSPALARAPRRRRGGTSLHVRLLSGNRLSTQSATMSGS